MGYPETAFSQRKSIFPRCYLLSSHRPKVWECTCGNHIAPSLPLASLAMQFQSRREKKPPQQTLQVAKKSGSGAFLLHLPTPRRPRQGGLRLRPVTPCFPIHINYLQKRGAASDAAAAAGARLISRDSQPETVAASPFRPPLKLPLSQRAAAASEPSSLSLSLSSRS